MLGWMRRAWQASRDRAKLLAPFMVRTLPDGCSVAQEVQDPELRAVLDAGGPELPPYVGLAALWHDHAGPRLPDYPAFLVGLARRHGIHLSAVLDLACGTGLMSTRLADVAKEVVGVDASDAMLAVARRESARPGVTFVTGDMRDFDLGRQFDAVVCASNSMNYVADRSELRRTFMAVARHLRPGGVFAFDTITEYGSRLLTGWWFEMTVGDRRFAMCSSFDPTTRESVSRVVVAEGVETHQRIAIDRADVRTAVAGTGLVVVDQFSSALPVGGFAPDTFAFHVLRRTV